MSDDFPTDVQQFIDQRIESVAQLEILMWLRDRRERAWSVDEIAAAVYAAPKMCAAQLADLERRGLLERPSPQDSDFRFRPADDETDRLISELARLYAERRVAVVSMIYSKPVRRVQTFADAFRLRREE